MTKGFEQALRALVAKGGGVGMVDHLSIRREDVPALERVLMDPDIDIEHRKKCLFACSDVVTSAEVFAFFAEHEICEGDDDLGVILSLCVDKLGGDAERVTRLMEFVIAHESISGVKCFSGALTADVEFYVGCFRTAMERLGLRSLPPLLNTALGVLTGNIFCDDFFEPSLPRHTVTAEQIVSTPSEDVLLFMEHTQMAEVCRLGVQRNTTAGLRHLLQKIDWWHGDYLAEGFMASCDDDAFDRRKAGVFLEVHMKRCPPPIAKDSELLKTFVKWAVERDDVRAMSMCEGMMCTEDFWTPYLNIPDHVEPHGKVARFLQVRGARDIVCDAPHGYYTVHDINMFASSDVAARCFINRMHKRPEKLWSKMVKGLSGRLIVDDMFLSSLCDLLVGCDTSFVKRVGRLVFTLFFDTIKKMGGTVKEGLEFIGEDVGHIRHDVLLAHVNAFTNTACAITSLAIKKDWLYALQTARTLCEIGCADVSLVRKRLRAAIATGEVHEFPHVYEALYLTRHPDPFGAVL